MNKKNRRTGVWIVGAYGDIATTLIVGCCAIRSELVSNTGLVTALSPMNQLDLIDLDNITFGGHDIIDTTVESQAIRVCENSKTFSHPLIQQITTQLKTINDNIAVLPELSWDVLQPQSDTPHLIQLLDKLRQLIKEFVTTNNLDHVITVNLASAETQVPLSDGHRDYASFNALIENDRKDLVAPSMLCALASFLEGCSYINFTPNPGASIAALQELAETEQLPFYGSDGKTGETLVKTALAPMFTARNLKVMSWEGTNMLGNGDGNVLKNPENCKNKIQNKALGLSNILGYPIHSEVAINYVPSLGDWKTAWDFIHFQGFLDVPMSMQFTWHGCDSILAAPLVIDMIRLAEFAHKKGESGPMYHLACFFKNPMGIEEHALYKQFEMLLTYTYKHLPEQQSETS